MSKDVGGCHVTLQLVISNATTKAKLENSIEQIAETLIDYPWLGLGDAIEQLCQAYEELRYVPD